MAQQVNHPYPNVKILAALSQENRASLLYELAWRHSVTLEYIQPWLAEALFELATTTQPCAIGNRQKVEIALALLHNTRLHPFSSDDEPSTIDAQSAALLGIVDAHALYYPDAAAEGAYHRALVARDKLDYPELSRLVDSIAGEDPVWMLRKAAMLTELGRSGEVTELLSVAYGRLLEHHRRDRNSVPIMSKLLWARWLLEAARRGSNLRTVEELPAFAESNYRKWECDPWTWIDFLRSEIDERRDRHLKRRNPIEPQFQQGSYRDNSDASTDGDDIADFLLLDGLSRICGVPLSLRSSGLDIGLLTAKATNVVLHGGTGHELRDLTLAIRAANSEGASAVKDVFARLRVACVSQQAVDILLARLQDAITYWQRERTNSNDDRQQFIRGRLQVLLEVTARIAVRVPPQQAKDLYRLALSLGMQPEMQNFRLAPVIDSLLSNTLASIPPTEQAELLPAALRFPLVVGFDDPSRWPNPVIEHVGARNPSSELDQSIADLIDSVRTHTDMPRTRALLRLLPIVSKDYLTPAEWEDLANAIWGESPSYTTLPSTGLLPHAVLVLPTKDANRAATLVRAHLYDTESSDSHSGLQESWLADGAHIQAALTLLNGMFGAATSKQACTMPTPEQAEALFDRFVAWRPALAQDKHWDFYAPARRQLAESVGRALSSSIAPALSAHMLTSGRLQRLQALYGEVDGAWTVLPAFVYFAIHDPSYVKDVERILALALRGRDPHVVTYAVFALRAWMIRPEAKSTPSFDKLVSMVIGFIEAGRTTGLPQLLAFARKLVEQKLLSRERCRVLAEAVPDIFATAAYANIESNSREAVTASTIRAECGKLAHAILRETGEESPELSTLIEEAQADTLPEVRFAIDGQARPRGGRIIEAKVNG
ncbi:hypothetical protein [Cupriavidus pinatubonensis]|uniref:hypothetical protein n=1 Tax=Cupriavidus pinatubonensis TaxID=248026 RepID=UPI001CC5AC77|nr:hypothetical protein [Cupriavidus pinatubonensis]